jgi:hypothetical protein
METSMSLGKRSKRLVLAILVVAIAAFVTVATVVQAIRQDNWGPIWAIGWLPAVLVAWLWTSASRRPCWPWLRGLTDR